MGEKGGKERKHNPEKRRRRGTGGRDEGRKKDWKGKRMNGGREGHE